MYSVTKDLEATVPLNYRTQREHSILLAYAVFINTRRERVGETALNKEDHVC